jgi:hypothetical protein
LSINNDNVLRAIEAAERELASIGGNVSEQVQVTYPMGMPCPSRKWAQETLKPLGVEGSGFLIFPHRHGLVYKGLFLTIRPNRDLAGDWFQGECPIANGGRELRWMNLALNDAYAKLSS